MPKFKLSNKQKEKKKDKKKKKVAPKVRCPGRGQGKVRLSPLTPSEPPTESYPVLYSPGRAHLFDTETGELLTSKALTASPVEKYSDEKVEILLSLLSQGQHLNEALENAGISRTTYILWRKQNPILGSQIENAKFLRQENINETFYEEELLPLQASAVMDSDPVEVAILDKKLKTLTKKQHILSKFKELTISEDRLNVGQVGAQSLKIEVAAEVAIALQKTYVPVNSEHNKELFHLPTAPKDVVEFERELKQITQAE